MSVQFFRLWPRRPPDGSLPLGLSLDDEGLLLAGNCRLIEACLDRDGHLFYRARSPAELSAILTAAYGEPINAAPIHLAVERIAKLMTERNWSRAKLAALHLRLRELSDTSAAVRVLNADMLLKVTGSFDPLKHPRWPKASEEGRGGEFRPADQGTDESIVPVAGRGSGSRPNFGELFRQILPRLRRDPPKPPEPPSKPGPPEPPAENQPGIGHNQPPEPIEDEPSQSPTGSKTPDLPPSASGRDIYLWGRRVAEALGEAARRGAEDIIHSIADSADAAQDWLHTQYQNIIAALDPPKTYDQLVRDAEELGGGSGYEVHHIVEQSKAKGDDAQFTEDQVEDPSNKVRIPYYTHKMIQSFYQTKNPDLGGLTPRQFLRGKSFEEQLEYGKGVLRKFGVMK